MEHKRNTDLTSIVNNCGVVGTTAIGTPKRNECSVNNCEDKIKKLREGYSFHMRRAQEIFELIGKFDFHEICGDTLPTPASTPPQVPRTPHRIRHIPKALSRKPRDLKFSPSWNEFITTSLDGRIFSWSMSPNNSLPQVKSSYLPTFLPSFLNSPGRPEHLFWRDDSMVAYLVTEGPNSEIISLNLDKQSFRCELKTQSSISAGHFSKKRTLLGNCSMKILLSPEEGHLNLPHYYPISQPHLLLALAGIN